jgi:Phage Tail Collar Domain
MGLFPSQFRDLLNSPDKNTALSALVDEVDSLTTRISALIDQEHNSDGTHNFVGKPYGLVPLGGMVQWHSNLTVPTTWLLCDGSKVSRTTYVNLFKVIGIKYGAGDGVNTFQLPTVSNFIILAGA